MKRKITIAIDGYSSTGKSTVAKQLAQYLDYVYIDTGAMYRAVTYYALQNNMITDQGVDKDKLIESLDRITLNFQPNKSLGYSEILLNSINVEKDIRSLKVSNYVSDVAAISKVREKLVAQQKQLGLDKGVVMDGRDIGTVVFPHAELKIFMTASAQERAQRRYKELVAKGENVSYDDVLKNVEKRDLIDTTRKDSPLVKAKDAIEVDNSNLTLEGQFQTILQLAQDRIVGRI